MAFGDLDSSPSLKSAINSTNAFSGIVVPANGWQLEVIHMPMTTRYEDIESLFAKYGPIERIGLFYKMKEKSVNCYLSFEREGDSVEALKENGKKVGVKTIDVIKFVNPSDKGNKRMRTDNDGGWGSSSTPKPANNGWGSTDTSSTDAWGSTPANSPAGGSSGRGRGGRGGGAGRGGSRQCYRCGEDGHMSRECPKGGSGGGSRSCFKCGEEGHMSRECPKGGGKGCFNCGEEGHMSRECSKPRASRGRGGNNSFGSRGNSSETTTSAPAVSTSDSLGWD